MIDANIIERLDKDLKKGASMMNRAEARYLVDGYYGMQKQRTAIEGQLRAATQGVDNAHCNVLEWMHEQVHTMEKQMARALEHYAKGHPVGQWATSIMGIGPVIASVLLAHIDIEKAPTAGAIWRYAGLDPKRDWFSAEKALKLVKEEVNGKKPTIEDIHLIAARYDRKYETLHKFATSDNDGEKIPLTITSLAKSLARRPHNAELKKRCWLIGESFTKVSGKDDAFYGKLYQKRKAEETVKNERGGFSEQAARALEEKNWSKSTEAYKQLIQGRLPKAQIHARAKRYAVKLFLAHFHAVYYEWHYGTPPPNPYPIAILGHKDYIAPPAPEIKD